MTLDFDDIRLRDGRSYRFAGLVEGVRTTNGETVRVDTEGAVRDESQTTKTEQRAAIGTAVGAIIRRHSRGGKVRPSARFWRGRRRGLCLCGRPK